ncbi:hypothetical protein HWV62_341 [Athelia sp. TMB]|nr:hypothetical protein HWV62_341 [Athelia sp. TMB]
MSNQQSTMHRVPTPFPNRLLAEYNEFERELNAPDYTFDYQPIFDPRYDTVDVSHSYEPPVFNQPTLPIPERPRLPPFQPTPGTGLPRATPATLRGHATPIIPRMDSPRPTTPILPPPPSPSDSSDNGTPPPRKTTPPTRGRVRGKWAPSELEELVRHVCEVNPFGAKHGEKGTAWKEVVRRLRAAGMCQNKSLETTKHKVMALIAYQEDPESRVGSSVARELSGTIGIKIAALLNRISEMQSVATQQNDEQKEQSRTKAEYNRIGGEAIRNSSMTTARTQRKRVAESTDSDTSDIENQPPVNPTRRPIKKARRTLSTTAQASSSAGDLSQLKGLIEEDGRRRDENQKEMVETLKESTRVYERTSEKYLAAILQLTNKD